MIRKKGGDEACTRISTTCTTVSGFTAAGVAITLACPVAPGTMVAAMAMAGAASAASAASLLGFWLYTVTRGGGNPAPSL